MFENWTKIYAAPDLFQVKIAEDVLKTEGIPSQISHKPDSVFPTVGEAELYVLNENAEQAMTVLREHDIL